MNLEEFNEKIGFDRVVDVEHTGDDAEGNKVYSLGLEGQEVRYEVTVDFDLEQAFLDHTNS